MVLEVLDQSAIVELLNQDSNLNDEQVFGHCILEYIGNSNSHAFPFNFNKDLLQNFTIVI